MTTDQTFTFSNRAPGWPGEHVCAFRVGATAATIASGEDRVTCSECGPRDVRPEIYPGLSGDGGRRSMHGQVTLLLALEDDTVGDVMCMAYEPGKRRITPAERVALGCPVWCTSGHGMWSGEPEPEHAADLEHGVSLEQADRRTCVAVYTDPNQMTAAEARQLAATLLNAADIADEDNAGASA